MIRNSCKRADQIITISENTKKDTEKFFSINEEKIKVIYLAPDSEYKKIDDKKKLISIREKYGLNKKFIFYSGSISPRKNIIRLVKAYENMYKEIDIDLVMTGNVGWNNQAELGIIEKNVHIKLLGNISKEDLVILYNLAEVCVYPSLYEGFGLPILEAQACGCPVITSNTSSMPEVAGRGAFLINPYDIKEITEAMKRVIIDSKLREELIKEGFNNVRNFSWSKCAKETLYICKQFNKYGKCE